MTNFIKVLWKFDTYAWINYLGKIRANFAAIIFETEWISTRAELKKSDPACLLMLSVLYETMKLGKQNALKMASCSKD